ncbi:MAG: choice-of-anchor D domain-containing protein [Gammaproteobacteria bacterium]|nr:choice-of-anchor D domain-containing protein [Gammaproteobacteria bacterium]
MPRTSQPILRWIVATGIAASLLLAMVLAARVAAPPRIEVALGRASSSSSPVGLAAPGVAAGPGAPDMRVASGAPPATVSWPLEFERNLGQADSRVQFLARGPGYTMLFAPGEATLKLRRANSLLAGVGGGALLERWLQRGVPNSATLRLRLLDADPTARWDGESALAGRSHYFIGRDPRRWVTGVEHFGRLRARSVYPGIDLVFYDGGGALEYDFHVAAGADPRAIRWVAEGAQRVELLPEGDLRLVTAIGDVRVRRPIAWQVGADNGRREVGARFVVDAQRRIGFALDGHDPSRPLIIDPVIAWAALLGANDNSTFALGLAVDGAGAAYVTGSTCSLQYPVVAGALKPQGGEIFGLDPCEDAFVTKLDPTGRSLVYSTFLGGADRETTARIAVDAAGAAYVTGITLSSDFPTTGSAVQRGLNGARNCRLPDGPLQICADAFVTKLGADGASLAWSTLLGGSAFDLGVGLTVDAAGAVYVQGWTNSSDFPTTSGAFDRSWGGGACSTGGLVPCFDSWVAKFAPDGASLGYSTYLGGNSREYGAGIEVDTGGNAYVTGSTRSTDFPTTPGAYRTTHTAGTQEDGYVVKLNPTGTALLWSTLFGGANVDIAYDLALDAGNGVAIVGTTDSTDLPTTAGALKTSTSAPLNACTLENLALIICAEGFVTRFAPDGASLVFSTYLGGSAIDGAFSIARDAGGDFWIGGHSSSTNFPFTPDALNSSAAIGGGFVARLAANGASLVFATTLRSDNVVALRSPATGVVLGAGTGSGSPTTPDGYGAEASGTGAWIFRIDPAAAPRLTLTPTFTSAFAALGGTSPPKTITISNPSAVAATIRPLFTDNFGGVQGIDDFIATDDCPGTLAAGASCTATLRYRPTETGSKTSYLRVLSNAIDTPHSASFGGSASDLQDGTFLPSALTFAPRAVGTQSDVLAASLINQGTVGAINRGYTVTGPNAADFLFDNVNCQPESFCTLNVRFAPMAGPDGARTATVTLATNLANDPKLLQLSGTVTSGAAATLSTNQLQFGAVRTNGSETRQVQLRNGGASALTGIGVALSGTDYSIGFNGCGSSLAAQASCNINVQLAPMGTGARSGTLTVSHDAPPAGPQIVTLAGIGADPTGPLDLGGSPTRTEFGPNVVGTTSTIVYFITVQNLGGSGMTGLTVSTTGPFTQTNDCPATLAQNLACTVQVRFAPTAEGAATGSVRIESNAPGSPRVLNFSGTGIRLAGARLSPGNLDFGAVGVGRSSAPRVATLLNTGPVAMAISSIIAPTPFTQTNDCGASLAAGASCTISVSYAPTAAVRATGVLTILSSAPGREHSTGLRGMGVTANGLATAPRSLDFGSQAISAASAPRAVTVTNNGTGTINLKGVVAPRYYTQTNDCGATLGAGASCTVNVRFAPTRLAPLSTIGLDAKLSIAGDFSGSPLLVPLTGLAVAGGPARSLSPSSLPLGSVAVGAAVTGDLNVSSTGTAPLVIASALVSGSHAADFTLVAPAAGATDCRGVASLAIGTSCVYRVRFAPAAAGARTATLTLTDNAAGSSVAIALSGTGSGGGGGGGTGTLAVSPASVSIAATLVGASTAAAPITLSNGGSAAVTINALTIGGADSNQFTTSSSCGALPATLATGENCSVTVNFAPSSAGAKAATLSIASSAAGSPASVALSGTASEFSIGPSGATSVSVAAGQSATVPLSVATSGGALPVAVSFAASGNPAGTTVTFSPATLAAGSSSGSTTLTIATTARASAALPRLPDLSSGDGGGARYASLLPLAPAPWLALGALGLALRGRRRAVLLALLLSCTLPGLLSGCGGGGGGGSSGGGGAASGTPAGTYTITVTATAGNVVRTSQVTLTVT